MAVDERSRHQLYNNLVETLGEEDANTMMQHLPPGGWSNLATKQDLLELEARMKAHTFRAILTTNLVTVAAFAAIAFRG